MRAKARAGRGDEAKDEHFRHESLAVTRDASEMRESSATCVIA